MSKIERISKVMEYLKEVRIALTQAEFAEKISVKPSQMSEMLTGKRVISERTIHKIVSVFPDVSEDWLLTGEGSMLKEGSPRNHTNGDETKGRVIPFFDAEAAAGAGYEMSMKGIARPAKMINIGSVLKDSESAIMVYGNSMIPNYPAGCVIGLKLHVDSFIEPGKVYVVETRDNRYLKRLYMTKDKNALRCISDNIMQYTSGPMEGEYCYPEFEIPVNEVVRLYRVVGVIKRNIL